MVENISMGHAMGQLAVRSRRSLIRRRPASFFWWSHRFESMGV